MNKNKVPAEFIKKCKSIKLKRPKTVIEHILKKGFITTEELKELYGYNHPPRAARDVRECGIPLETFRVESSDGRSIAAYKFGDPFIGRFVESRKGFNRNSPGCNPGRRYAELTDPLGRMGGFSDRH